jgi:protein involved in polysaccharide export with SLBB domain
MGMKMFVRFLPACLVICAHMAFAQALSPAMSPVAPAAVDAAAAEYRLGSDDKVRITVFNEPNLSGEFSVSSSGILSLPLIGEVKAAGRSMSEVSNEITSRLANGYLRSPHVSIDVLNYRPFYILGEVNKPGEYSYINGLTVQAAVATAQGYTYRANRKRIFMKHAGDKVEGVITQGGNTLVHPGDTIRVAERTF